MAYLVDITLDGSGLYAQVGPFNSEKRARRMAARVARECRRREIAVAPYGEDPPENYEVQVDITETFAPDDWRSAVPQ